MFSNARAAVDLGLDPYGLVAKSQICTKSYGMEIYPDGTYHHEYPPMKGSRYRTVDPTDLATSLATRTPDQARELADFADFLNGVGTTQGTDVLLRYCYALPQQ